MAYRALSCQENDVRASVDPLRDRAVELIEAARETADDALQSGGTRVRDLVDAHADQASSGVDRGFDAHCSSPWLLWSSGR